MCPPPTYQGLPSPAKHVAVVQQPAQIQIQPQIQVAAQQQYVPVSVVEQNSRQMLLTNAVSGGWGQPVSSGRAAAPMLVPPTWQQVVQPPHAAAGPLIPDSDTWRRTLLVESNPTLLPVSKEKIACREMEQKQATFSLHLWGCK